MKTLGDEIRDQLSTRAPVSIAVVASNIGRDVALVRRYLEMAAEADTVKLEGDWVTAVSRKPERRGRQLDLFGKDR